MAARNARAAGGAYEAGWPADDGSRAGYGKSPHRCGPATLQQRGWIEGRNIHIDRRFFESGLDNARIRDLARDLVALRPDVIFASTTRVVVQVLAETATIPVVFAAVSDPVGQGLVKTLARPGGMITGFSNLEFSLVAKWLQLLKEVAPTVKRVALLLSAQNGSRLTYVSVLKEAAPSFGLQASVLL